MEEAIYALEVRTDPNGGDEPWFALYRVTLGSQPRLVQVGSFYDGEMAVAVIEWLNGKERSGQRPEHEPLDLGRS